MKLRQLFTRRRLLAASCVLALVGLALMCWSVVDPRPNPVMVALSIGQGIGTTSLLLFLIVVIGDVRRVKLLDKPPDDEVP
jgi:hypothetical protein